MEAVGIVRGTKRNGNAILFVGYSSERNPFLGYIENSEYKPVERGIVLGSGKMVVELGRWADEGSGLEAVVDTLKQAHRHKDHYKGYQIMVVPRLASPRVRAIANLEGNTITGNDINYLLGRKDTADHMDNVKLDT